MFTPIDKLVLIEKITKIIPNRYEAVRVMAKEARRLNSLILRGAEADPDFKPTSAAVHRVIENRVKFQYIDPSEVPSDFDKE